jgi:hypothetical protein
MKKMALKLCFNLVAFTLIFTLGKPVLAEKITVKKVKGTQALVETTSELVEGQTYELAVQPLSEEVDYKQSVLKARNNSLTLGTSFDYIKSELLSDSRFDLQARYGWNFSTLEFGVLVKFSTSDQGGGATTSFLGGGYFDYNLVSNRDPRNFVYGPFVLLATGSTQYPNAATGGSSTKLESNLGGFLTYFLVNTNTAVRGEAYYNYQQINTTAQQNSVAGFGFRGLLLFYF